MQDLSVSAIRTFPILTYLSHDRSIRVFLLFVRSPPLGFLDGRAVPQFTDGCAIWPEPKIYILRLASRAASCREFGTSQHCRVAGHSLPNSSKYDSLIRAGNLRSARSDVTSDLFKAVEMSRLAQRLGAGVGIAAGIRFARLCESRLSLRIRFALGILDRAGRGLMMKLRAYGLISTRCSRATGRRRRC